MQFFPAPKALAGSLCALGALLYFSWITLSPPVPAPTEVAVAETPPPAPTPALDSFGIEEGAYRIDTARIERGQTFSGLLGAFGIDAATSRTLAEAARPVFNIRHLRAGRALRVYRAGDQPQVVVYERDPIHYVVFDLRGAPRVYAGEKPVEVRQRTVAGTLDGSPYQTLVQQGADPALAVKLADVFAWQIDFYRLRRGDRFHLVYEEQVVDGEPVGTGAILAARFAHAGEDFYAFRHVAGDRATYYDEQGRSLRKAFLKAPLKYSRISSRYTKRRFHPVLKRYKAHLGTDYAAPTGTPIHATGDGVVVAAGYTRGNGRYVKIRHNGTYTTGYLHMSKIGKGIKNGVRVRQGDVIGYVGSTGLATGPHLCYRFWKNGTQVDPLRLELPSAEPLPQAQWPAFTELRAEYLPFLHDGPLPQFANGPAPSIAQDMVAP